MAILEDTIVVYGGVSPFCYEFCKDVWVYNISSNQWKSNIYENEGEGLGNLSKVVNGYLSDKEQIVRPVTWSYKTVNYGNQKTPLLIQQIENIGYRIENMVYECSKVGPTNDEQFGQQKNCDIDGDDVFVDRCEVAGRCHIENPLNGGCGTMGSCEFKYMTDGKFKIPTRRMSHVAVAWRRPSWFVNDTVVLGLKLEPCRNYSKPLTKIVLTVLGPQEVELARYTNYTCNLTVEVPRLIPSRRFLFSFGGYGGVRKTKLIGVPKALGYFKDIWRYDIDSEIWEEMNPPSSCSMTTSFPSYSRRFPLVDPYPKLEEMFPVLLTGKSPSKRKGASAIVHNVSLLKPMATLACCNCLFQSMSPLLTFSFVSQQCNTLHI